MNIEIQKQYNEDHTNNALLFLIIVTIDTADGTLILSVRSQVAVGVGEVVPEGLKVLGGVSIRGCVQCTVVHWLL